MGCEHTIWEQFLRNQARLQANQARATAVGAVRHGPALLAGLVVCARCGGRMGVYYTGRSYTYECRRLNSQYGAPRCQQVAGPGLDAFAQQPVLAALQPAALELSLEAASHVERERADLERLWQQRLERAAYEAERAGRQYRLVEPENRLVARQLEREWEATLTAQQHLEEEYHRFQQQQPRVLAPAEREAIRRLAADIPARWAAPTTRPAERKEIVRQVVAQLVVAVQGTSEQVQVTVVWVGGARTTATVTRPVRRWEQLSSYAALEEQVRRLTAAGLTATQIAESCRRRGTDRRSGVSAWRRARCWTCSAGWG